VKPVTAVLIAALSSLLAGCAAVEWLTPPPSRTPEPSAIERELSEAMSEAAAAPVQPNREAPAESEPTSDSGRFDVSVKDMSAREFLLSLFADSPHNLVMDADLTGTVTVSLKSVTVEEVLSALKDVYGYSWQRRPYGYHVGSSGLQTRLFQVDYLDLRRAGHSQTRVSSGQVSDRPNVSQNGFTSVPATISDQTRAEFAGSVVKTDSVANLWSDLQQSLVAIAGQGAGRSVVLNQTAGVVVVRALPDELEDVADFLGEVQDSLERQVILEAKILEVSLNDGFQAGINWAQITQDAILAQTGGGSLLADGVSEIAGNTGDLVGALPSGTDTSAFGGAFTAALGFQDFKAFIELLETQGEVHILSSPRVAAMNNQKAVIKVGTDEFFVTDVSTTTVASTSPIVTPDITLTPFFSGIALDVTPQISQRGEITLHVHPSISQVDDQTKTIVVGDTEQTLPLARSTIRESDSVVRAASGQVIVLGGLMQQRQNLQRAGTPWFDRIPLFGLLFRQQRDTGDRTELVILLRAVIADPAAVRRSIAQSAARVSVMRTGGAPAAEAEQAGTPQTPSAP
jgi:MSHA biogenesis protein MshL